MTSVFLISLGGALKCLQESFPLTFSPINGDVNFNILDAISNADSVFYGNFAVGGSLQINTTFDSSLIADKIFPLIAAYKGLTMELAWAKYLALPDTAIFQMALSPSSTYIAAYAQQVNVNSKCQLGV